MSRRRSEALLVVLGLALASCKPALEIPKPDLTRVEDGVKAKVFRCRNAVKSNPSYAMWMKYGRTLHAHRMWAEAEAAYVAAANTKAPTDRAKFEAWHLAGCSAIEFNAPRAVEHFTKALAVRNDYLPTHLNLAIVAERLGHTELARKHYELVASTANASHAHLGLGRMALRAGDAKTALQHLLRANQKNPEHKEVYEVLARCYTRLGQREEGRAAAKQAGDLEVTTPFGDPLIATVDAEAVDIKSRFNRAARNANAGKLAESIEEFGAIVAARPRHITARFYLAIALHKHQQPDLALTQLDTVLTQNPRHAKGLELRAQIRIDQGNKSAAQADLRALLAIQPDHTWAKAQLEK